MTGIISAVAGVSYSSGSTDGVGTSAKFKVMTTCAADSTSLLVVDYSNALVRSVDRSTNTVTTLGATPTADPRAVFKDSLRNQVYLTSASGSTVYIYQWSGSSWVTISPAGSAGRGLAIDPYGYVLMTQSSTMRKLVDSSTLSTWAGSSTSGSAGDGLSPLQARFAELYGVVQDTAGNYYVADRTAHVIRYRSQCSECV